jgi:protein tyrosine/serine phosphatase
MKYYRIVLFFLCITATFMAGCCPWELFTSNTQIPSDINPAARSKWAQPLELQGVPNLYKVSDNLYRGAQPTVEGMKQLEKMGVKTVVNLRTFFSDCDEIDDAELAYKRIRTTAWHLESIDVVRFLRIICDSNATPVFVHCMQGSDRTGAMCAVYRVTVQGWSKEQAIEEMTKGGYGYHSIWCNLPGYVRKLDIEKIKQQAGLK